MLALSKLLLLTFLTAQAVYCQRRPNNRNLVAVVQVFRHGQRTPAGYYTNYPYQNTTFWGGLAKGQLTNEGRRQHFDLGQFTRRRYDGWLPSRYDKDVFYAQTTDVDRTHMSAQSNIYGLFRARGDQVWNRNTDWQAIPVHPADTDVLTAFMSTSCTAYYTEYANALTDEVYLALDEKYADVYAYLTENTGDDITTFTEADTAYDCLKVTSDVGLPFPAWARSVYPDALRELAGYYFESYAHTTKLQRLIAGPFFNEIVEFFEDMTEDSSSSAKYQMYSAHDFNIAGVLKTLDASDPPLPPDFASTLYFELRNNSGSYYVNVWSKNSTDFVPVSIRGCDLDCPLSDVKDLLGDILVDADTRNTECTESTAFKNEHAEKIYSKLVGDTEEKTRILLDV